MPNKELIYIIATGAIAVYAILLTVMLVVMNRKVKNAHILLEEKIQKNSDDIHNADQKMQKTVADIDERFNKEKESTDKRIGEIFDNTLTATAMLVDEKTKNLTDKMDDISIRLNIMDSTIKNIESEKAFVRSLIEPPQSERPIEAEYKGVPKDGFLNNARKAVKNAAKAGGDIVKNLFGSKSDDVE